MRKYENQGQVVFLDPQVSEQFTSERRSAKPGTAADGNILFETSLHGVMILNFEETSWQDHGGF